MARRTLLTLRDADLRVSAEILGSGDAFAELVDPHDGSVLHSEPFALQGGEWQIANVSVTDEITYIECVSTSAPSDAPAPEPSEARET